MFEESLAVPANLYNFYRSAVESILIRGITSHPGTAAAQHRVVKTAQKKSQAPSSQSYRTFTPHTVSERWVASWKTKTILNIHFSPICAQLKDVDLSNPPQDSGTASTPMPWDFSTLSHINIWHFTDNARKLLLLQYYNFYFCTHLDFFHTCGFSHVIFT